MDCHVRWFRREIMLRVAHRLVVELGIVIAAVIALSTAAGASAFETASLALLTMPAYPVVRLVSSLLLNPTSSSYMNQWERPSGTLMIEPPSSIGNDVDLALTAAGFSAAGSFSEWGGATTDVYANAAESVMAITSSVDDIILLTGLADGRTCVSTRHLIPPHSRLIVNHAPTAEVADLVAEHSTLVADLLRNEQLDHVALDITAIPDLLVTEWETWQQIGPGIAPFVDVEHKRQPSLLRARVPRERILAQGRGYQEVRLTMPPVEAVRASEPAQIREPVVIDEPVAAPAPAMGEAAVVIDESEPVLVPQPSLSRLDVLRAQAQLAAEQTDRAISAGGS